MEQCRSIISFGDVEGDNSTTFHCQHEVGHGGDHFEEGEMNGQTYQLKWMGESPADVTEELEETPKPSEVVKEVITTIAKKAKRLGKTKSTKKK